MSRRCSRRGSSAGTQRTLSSPPFSSVIRNIPIARQRIRQPGKVGSWTTTSASSAPDGPKVQAVKPTVHAGRASVPSAPHRYGPESVPPAAPPPVPPPPATPAAPPVPPPPPDRAASSPPAPLPKRPVNQPPPGP